MQLTHRLQIGASLWLGYRYARTGEQQEAPQMINGFPTSLYGTGTRAVDCSTFCAWMLMHTCRQLQDREAYEALQIWDATKPFSNVDLCISRGIASSADTPARGCWHLVQTWQGEAGKSQGHSRLAYCNGSALASCLESTISDRADGPQWREVQWSDLLSRHAVRLARLY